MGRLPSTLSLYWKKDYIKNTPYAERSERDDIPFWACTPFHLDYVATDEENLDQILAGMVWSKRFQALFGKAAFYHCNPGMDASGPERNILASVLMHHIAMVCSINKVPLRGISHPDRLFPLTRYDDKEPENDLTVTRSLRELMMEKKVQGTKVWTLIAQTPDGKWMGFYRFGTGNNPHCDHAVDWSTALSSNVWFYLLHRGFDPKNINALIWGTFDYQSTKEAAQATVDKDGRI
jgi:hypothetical protein